MKFSKLREFRQDGVSLIADVRNYLMVDLVFSLRELYNGLTKLSFDDNFNSFTVSVTVPATSELPIRNQLDRIPTGKIILRDGASNAVVDGATAWTRDFVYIQNTSGSAVDVTVVFFV